MNNKKVAPGSVTVLGIPFDDNSSFLKGTAGAPSEIRRVLHSGAGNYFTENLIDLKNHPQFSDAGDLIINDFVEDISNGVSQLLDRNCKVLSLGGDHSITYPIVHAYSSHYPELNVLHIDAHPDLYPEFEGNPYSHACPFARIMEAGYVKRLVQVGIRAVTQEQKEQAERFNVEQIEMNNFDPEVDLNFEGPVYISFDMDGLDPAFAPAVSHPEPGGLSVRDTLNIIRSVNGPIVGADIVEYNPVRDTFALTASVAVKLLKEIAGIMVNCY